MVPDESRRLPRRRFLGSLGVLSAATVAGSATWLAGGPAYRASASASKSGTVDADSYTVTADEDRVTTTLSIEGPTLVNVSGLEYRIDWPVRSADAGGRPHDDVPGRFVYLDSLTFGPATDSGDFAIQRVALRPATDPDTLVAGGVTVSGDSFSVADPHDAVGCVVHLDLGTRGRLDAGDTFAMTAELVGRVARAGGLPGAVIDDFRLSVDLDVTYAGESAQRQGDE